MISKSLVGIVLYLAFWLFYLLYLDASVCVRDRCLARACTTRHEEDNLYVTAELPEHEVLYHYPLTFRDNVEVLAPAYIRDGIRDEVCSILKNMKHDRGFHVMFAKLVLESENF